MGAWYWIGVSVGLGAGAGVLLAGLVGRTRGAVAAVGVLALAAGAGIGYAIDRWQPGGVGNVIGALLGGLLASFGAAQVVTGALRRGGTRGATALLVTVAAAVVAALGWVPALGYLEAVLLPALAFRIRRRLPERYAGLRSLARD